MPFIPRKRTSLEFLDLPPEVCTLEELEGSLSDIRIVNRYLGDTRALLKHLSAKVQGQRHLSVLDVATGSADLPVAIVEWARKKGIDIQVTGVDLNSRTIDIARRHATGYPEIKLLVADALQLPFRDQSFDLVLCSKTLHHMKEPEVVAALQEMLRVARRGFIVMDLRRSWIAYVLIYLLTRIFTRNRMTRYDGPLSVLKAFTADELRKSALQAGATSITIRREPFWLLVVSGEIA
ncbi:methyltransferase domain-containing protein [Geomonas sp. Red69]|uniref:Methyltransferase domain-containing protein n=1 Tax=Geomonas diazotrophica TaxID=2843197 RepID=A0ABX8JGG4_9BACT|nr:MULTISPECIES: methyltransferase domain-containing protein [Geomonas]MBU5637849.1 methyltransferase domain-containing protein [Geomonas diazotrophica]QWV96572.1 methyltransferase domain-containing protein [Geomonas nitrogeniifigens]QXE85674.1 methyltransferase domain-containing protein [Geomonas nitrogeniifigens]